LFEFISRTVDIRKGLPEDHTLFLTYLESTTKSPNSIRPTTIASWIRQELEIAGIDTNNFTSHSIRAAASTKAIELGHSIQDVKKHAHRSLNT
jgi:hypothetical protein